jgi:hypothetical protein
MNKKLNISLPLPEDSMIPGLRKQATISGVAISNNPRNPVTINFTEEYLTPDGVAFNPQFKSGEVNPGQLDRSLREEADPQGNTPAVNKFLK